MRCRDVSPAFSPKPCKALETKVGEERVGRKEERRGRWPRREERTVEGVPRRRREGGMWGKWGRRKRTVPGLLHLQTGSGPRLRKSLDHTLQVHFLQQPAYMSCLRGQPLLFGAIFEMCDIVEKKNIARIVNVQVTS